MYDLAIVGSGSAAFAAAIAASRLGRSVVMIERDEVGGTCVNVGCVPSKALLAAADARHGAAHETFPGIGTKAEPVDFATLVGGVRELVDEMRTEKYLSVAAKFGWQILAGTARFVPATARPAAEQVATTRGRPNARMTEGGTPAARVPAPPRVQPGPALRVSGPDGERVVEAAHYLVATGAAPTVPPIPGLAETGHLDSTTALDLREVPESLLVVGGNAVGLEQAQLFARLGARVTVVEQLDRLVPFDEPEASAAIADAFAGDGIEVHTGAEVVRVRRTGDTVTALLRGRDGLEWLADVSHVLVATGRRPATAGLGLEDVGVGVGPRGEIVVDHHLRTGNPRIWAAGDVTGAPQFVYVAARAGGMAAENALTGAGRAMDYRHLPRVTFTDPAVASAGLTEATARMEGIDSETRVLGIDYVPRALVTRDARGLVKLVVERKTGRLIGATVVADGAGEVIAAATYALTAGMTVDQLADAWSPYLTMAEGLRLAAQAFSRDLSTLSCCVA